MGILRRIKNRLPIVGKGSEERPAASYSPPPAQAAPVERAKPPPPKSPEDVKAEIDADVKRHPIVIYMKGNARAPQCGFSARVVDIFNQVGAPFETRNVLADPAIRQGVKEYTDWPTIPQIFVAGEFIGGCDITIEMFENGELKTLVEETLQSA
jgi:monothiol glutaredoxin